MKPSPELIDRFLNNQCSEAEAEAIQAWFHDHPEDLERHLPLQDWLVDTKKQTDPERSDRMLQEIRKVYPANHVRWLIRFAAAASIIAILIITALKFLPEQKNSPATIATKQTPKTPEKIILTNTTTYTLKQKLSDGSLITLYPNSSLQYLPDFDPQKRELNLTGKASFKVSKDASRPFTVYAAGIFTTALGTEFTITVINNRKATIALKEGLVRIGSLDAADKNASVFLHPGDQLTVSSGKFRQLALTRKNRSDTATDSTPKEKTSNLVFKNEPLKNVLQSIEEKFSITINHDKSIDEKLFTGTFLESEDLDFIMRLICQLHGLSYTIEGNTITIKS